ncbi:hypothetical protein PV325_002554 [Microctonus aethiopoides]|nr:hypothetical protein PV325_002554 [Microctonus aethiopoides]
MELNFIHMDVELHEGSIPADASEVSVSRCRELRIHSGAFTGGAQLKRVHVTGIHSFVAKRQAFNNITAPNPLLEVTECNRVVLESHAFKNALGTLSVSISKCKHVEIKSNAFSWLLRFSIRQVETLELSTNAFHFDAPPYGRHGPATKSVKISELPTSVFPSPAAEIRMDDVWTRVIRKDAFCAISILGVRISNASIYEIESGAFRHATLIPNFELSDVRLKIIKNGAFTAGVTNFTIQYSRINEIENGAIEVSAAAVAFNNNEFHKLGKKSIVLQKWSRIIIDDNLFVDMDVDAIVADEIAAVTPHLVFSFRGNHITRANPSSLRFVSLSEKATIAHVGNNYFDKVCSCEMEDWVREVTGKNSSTVWMTDSSYCVAGKWLENCLKVPQGYLLIKNFTNTICTPSGNIICKEPSDKPASTISPPSVGPHIYPRQNSYFDVEMSDPEQLEREKRLIIIVCIGAIFILVAIILTAGIIYMRRRGVCPKLSSTPLMNFANSWLSPSNGMTAATSARSISRLSVNEYAGLRPETRILNVESEMMNNDDDLEVTDNFTYTENKATQTLPEELTEEYLKDLREKLNDPDNYSQARDMIEHLYDLIKVEESCNNNNTNNSDEHRPTLMNNEENPYDIIAPRIKRTKIQKPMVSVGTRTPSLEKLVPIERIIRPIVSEYTEPRDHQRTNATDQNHLYAELPGDDTVPSTSRLTQSINFDNLINRAPLPLPPDVVNDHIINDNRDINYCDVDIDNYYQETLNNEDLNYKNQQQKHQRPLNFLKVIGENLMGTNKNKKSGNSSLFCEYVDPTDVTAHLYAELPEPNINSEVGLSTPASKMANRPLPIKPDQENINNLART